MQKTYNAYVSLPWNQFVVLASCNTHVCLSVLFLFALGASVAMPDPTGWPEALKFDKKQNRNKKNVATGKSTPTRNSNKNVNTQTVGMSSAHNHLFVYCKTQVDRDGRVFIVFGSFGLPYLIRGSDFQFVRILHRSGTYCSSCETHVCSSCLLLFALGSFGLPSLIK